MGSKLMRMLNLNVNGIRKRAKRIELAELLRKLKIGVCVLTETHLRKEECDRTHFKYYSIAAESCRKDAAHIGGGVMILVHHIYKSDKFEGCTINGDAIKHCSVKFYLSSDPATALLITGVYMPPRLPGNITMTDLGILSAGANNLRAAPKSPRIMAGDFNTTSWLERVEDWCQEEGIWHLNDPCVPTINTGSSIDKFLFKPGDYIPTTFLPHERVGLKEMAGRDVHTYVATMIP